MIKQGLIRHVSSGYLFVRDELIARTVSDVLNDIKPRAFEIQVLGTFRNKPKRRVNKTVVN